MRILYSPVGSCATSCQRLIYPLMALQKAGKAEVEVLNTNDVRSQLRKADLVVLQCLIGPEQHQLIDYIHEQGKKVVVDYDDLMSDLPSRLLKNLGMEQETITQNWIKYLNSADTLTTPSQTLAMEMQDHTGTPIQILDNLIPRSEYEASDAYTPFDDSNEVRIMYSCSESHLNDFQFMGPILKEIGEKYPNVTVVSQGGLEFGYHFWDYNGKTLHEPKTSYGSYFSMLRRVKPHIFLGPLTLNSHNTCRSNLKYYQAGAVKAAFIGSNMPPFVNDSPYAGRVRHGSTGYTVPGSAPWEISKESIEEQWISTLSRLIEDRELNKKIGTQAYEDMKGYILEDRIDEWESVYKELLE